MPDEPPFDEYDERELPRGMQAELRSLSPETAHAVGGHLRMAGLLVDEDPAAALQHAQAAKRRAVRLPVVREAMAETAYAAEDYRLALAEYQVLYRLTDDDNYLPVMADCQRALGKPAAALELLGRADSAHLTPEQRVEAVLVAAGARQDLDQSDEAQRLLRSAIAGRRGGRAGQARLRYAYGELLSEAGETDQAREWFASAAELDPENETDARRRLAQLDGQPVDEEDETEADDDSPDDEDEWDLLVEEEWDDDPRHDDDTHEDAGFRADDDARADDDDDYGDGSYDDGSDDV